MLSHFLGPVPWYLATTDRNLAKIRKSKLTKALENEVPPLDEGPESSWFLMLWQ